MKLPLQITFRDVEPQAAIEALVRRRAQKLDQWLGKLMSCHVAIESAGHHQKQGHQFRVRISVRSPDQDIEVGEHHLDEDLMRAVQRAFDAADRSLEDSARRRRGQTKPHHPVLRGRIEALSDDGVGSIVSASGEHYHFDRSHVAQPDFDHLAVGQEVHFLEGLTRAGREARRITVLTEPLRPE